MPEIPEGEGAEEIPAVVYTAEQDDDPGIMEETDPDHPWKSMYHSADYYISNDFESFPMIVEGAFPASSVTLIGGAPKSGKSFLALDLGLSIAIGRPFMGEFDVSQGKVLYLALEDSAQTIAPRIKAMVDGNPKGLKDLHIMTECARWDKGGNRVVASWIVDNQKDAKMIIIDTHQKFRPTASMGGGYNNDYNSLTGLVSFAHKSGIPVAVLHHTTKSGGQRGGWMSAFSGSYGLIAPVDNLMVIKKEKKTTARLYMGGRSLEEARYRAEFDKSSLRWIINNNFMEDDEEDDGLDILSSVEMKILEVLMREADRSSMPAWEIYNNAGVNENTAKTAMRKLVQKKRVERVKQGWYRLVGDSDAQPA